MTRLGESVARATTLLSNRVIYLHITGTLSHPTISVDPARQLAEEAVRFFLLAPLQPGVRSP